MSFCITKIPRSAFFSEKSGIIPNNNNNNKVVYRTVKSTRLKSENKLLIFCPFMKKYMADIWENMVDIWEKMANLFMTSDIIYGNFTRIELWKNNGRHMGTPHSYSYS
jgi:hypothetical protein